MIHESRSAAISSADRSPVLLHGWPKAQTSRIVTFTTSGEACAYDFECGSYNCLGFCAYGKGGPRQGALCREDADSLEEGATLHQRALEFYKVGGRRLNTWVRFHGVSEVA